MTAALACVLSLNLSCGKNPPPPAARLVSAPAPTNPDAAAANTNAAVTATNPAPVAEAPAAITNLPIAATTPVPPPATPEPAPTVAPAAPPHTTVVEMPATVPVAPTHFYSGDFAQKTNCCTLAKCEKEDEADYFSLLIRGGYQHANHGDNNDTYYVSARVAVDGDELREHASKSAWLMPDAYAEISHQYLPKPDDSKQPGSGEGIQFRADFYWPWTHWTSQMFARTNAVCPLSRPLALGFGPTANLGFDQLFDGSPARLARYAGVRANVGHGFIEYVVGGTDGLSGIRNQVLTELPFYASRKNGVRYYFRGLWNTGYNSSHDELEAGLFVELPIETLVRPTHWGSLIPGHK